VTDVLFHGSHRNKFQDMLLIGDNTRPNNSEHGPRGFQYVANQMLCLGWLPLELYSGRKLFLFPTVLVSWWDLGCVVQWKRDRITKASNNTCDDRESKTDYSCIRKYYPHLSVKQSSLGKVFCFFLSNGRGIKSERGL